MVKQIKVVYKVDDFVLISLKSVTVCSVIATEYFFAELLQIEQHMKI